MGSELKLLQTPLITEKGTLVAEHGQVVFKVPTHATKFEIRRAVEKLFSVKVTAVRTANFLGKKKRAGKILGKRPAWKKAYITLADGNAAELLEKI
ncbi:MAG TPA: 50S ribosomal protein L23 [Candidatus Binatia bacterium]|jgi:large subunit ribosomal protein L23